MSTSKYGGDYATKYLKTVLDAEKRTFTLKALRDSIEEKANENRYSSFAVSQEADIEAKRPAVPTCNYKELPKRPVIDAKSSKMLKMSLIFFEAGIVLAVLLLITFAITAKKTTFFTEPYVNSGIFGILFIIFSGLAVFSFIAGLAFRFVEYVRFRNELEKWRDECRKIREYNNEEKERVLRLTLELQEKYDNEVELLNVKRGTEALIKQAKAEAFDLERAKISNSVYIAERELSQLYSERIIDPKYRRIDIITMFESYISNSDAFELDDAIRLYEKQLKEGLVAQHLSDIYDEPDRYSKTMIPFFDALDEMLASVDKVMADADELALTIAEKSVDKEESKIKKNILAMQFQKEYDNTQLAEFAAELAGIAR